MTLAMMSHLFRAEFVAFLRPRQRNPVCGSVVLKLRVQAVVGFRHLLDVGVLRCHLLVVNGSRTVEVGHAKANSCERNLVPFLSGLTTLVVEHFEIVEQILNLFVANVKKHPH